MNTYLHTFFIRFEQVIHPAAGKLVAEKKKNRASAAPITPKATPDSRNIRGMYKKEDSFRRSPAP